MTSSSNINRLPKDEELAIKGAHYLGPTFDSKFEELKYEIIHKMDKELADSTNARQYISQKYDELCSKIQFLTELDATVSGFRSDIKTLEKQVTELAMRVDQVEDRLFCKDNSSLMSANLLSVPK